ncbi:MAG TPA: 5-methyltetrahydropteroyltriglutamate--homocysteine S-methyltransferase, partial [Nocardioides sp.]|nr:5-methyltetrahydropteroyltriglutamate--homocysteine S-methyltransferase [Nocardioides sp.]
MTRRDLPPFRADHVGSLLRPPRLLQARADHAEGRIDAAGLRDVEDDAIREVVRMQEDLGLQTATDGEFRRTSWHMDFIYQLSGIHRTDEKIEVHFRNADGNLDFTS